MVRKHRFSEDGPERSIRGDGFSWTDLLTVDVGGRLAMSDNEVSMVEV